MSHPPLDDGVVTLRPPDERDLDAIEIGIRDPDVVRWFGQPEGSAEEVLALDRRRSSDGSPTFAICEADDACVGLAWVNLGTTDPATGYVGYWLLPGSRGRGLATRAVRLLASWAPGALRIRRLRLVTAPGNERSQRVAERCGFRRVDLPMDHAEVVGRRADLIVYELPRVGRDATGRRPEGRGPGA